MISLYRYPPVPMPGFSPSLQHEPGNALASGDWNVFFLSFAAVGLSPPVGSKRGAIPVSMIALIEPPMIAVMEPVANGQKVDLGPALN
jgi:hypothetical protein